MGQLRDLSSGHVQVCCDLAAEEGVVTAFSMYFGPRSSSGSCNGQQQSLFSGLVHISPAAGRMELLSMVAAPGRQSQVLESTHFNSLCPGGTLPSVVHCTFPRVQHTICARVLSSLILPWV